MLDSTTKDVCEYNDSHIRKKQVRLPVIVVFTVGVFIFKEILFVKLFQSMGFRNYDSIKLTYVTFFISFLAFTYYALYQNGIKVMNNIKIYCLGLEVKTVKYILGIALCLTFLQISFMALQNTTSEIFDTKWYEFILKDKIFYANSALGSIAFGYLDFSTCLFILVQIILSPVAEEIFFRGFIQSNLVNKTGQVSALIITSTLFTLLHNQNQFIAIFISSAVFGFVFLRTKNLLYPILLHSFTNLLLWLSEGFGMLLLYTNKDPNNLSNIYTWKIEILLFFLFVPILVLLLTKVSDKTHTPMQLY